MLKIYGVKKGVEYVSFWLRKSDADAAACEEDCDVVTIEVQENCPQVEEDD